MAKIYNIAVIKGDGIGPEIVDEAIKALDAASAEFGFELSYFIQYLSLCNRVQSRRSFI